MKKLQLWGTVGLVIFGLGCELIATTDRNKIVANGGSGGSGGDGGAGGATTTTTTGNGGAGGSTTTTTTTGNGGAGGSTTTTTTTTTTGNGGAGGSTTTTGNGGAGGNMCPAPVDQENCVSNSWSDGETGVDCGGVCRVDFAALCPSGQGCEIDEDCVSGNCNPQAGCEYGLCQ